MLYIHCTIKVAQPEGANLAEQSQVGRRKIETMSGPLWDPVYECKAVVRLRNGESIAVEASPEDDGMFDPGRDEAMQAFHDMTAHAMPESQRREIVDAVLQLESLLEVVPLTARLVLPHDSVRRVA